MDHGQNFETVKEGGVYGDYLAARAKGKHIEVKAGDRIPIEGLDVAIGDGVGQGDHHADGGRGAAESAVRRASGRSISTRERTRIPSGW